MKNNKIFLGGLALAFAALISSCSTTSRTVYRDDVYNNRDNGTVYQSPDYYYTDGTDEESIAQSDYYADEYSDEDYVEGGVEDLEYANRINRFYYNSPGMMYYDPWFDPWYGYSGFGLGWNSGFGWSLGFGWGSPYLGMAWGWGIPYYGYGWGRPYYGYGWGNYWGPNSYYNYWGHPYYGGGYGNAYYGGNYYGNRRVASGRSYSNGYAPRSNSGRVTRDASGRFVNSRAGVSSGRSGTRSSGTVGRTPSSRSGSSRSEGTINRTPSSRSGSSRSEGTINRTPSSRSGSSRSQGTINRTPSSRSGSSRYSQYKFILAILFFGLMFLIQSINLCPPFLSDQRQNKRSKLHNEKNLTLPYLSYPRIQLFKLTSPIISRQFLVDL